MKKNRVSDREVAAAILHCLARHEPGSFCCHWHYDYDIDFLNAVAERVGLAKEANVFSWCRRMARVCRRLQEVGVLSGRVSSCHAEYIGEPRALKSYVFSNPSYACRIAPDLHPHYTPLMRPESEVEFLLERF